MVKSSKKQEKILIAACHLFAENEFHIVSMDDIANNAGVGKGTLYNYFTSKDDLYFSIIQYRLSSLLVILENTYNRRNDPVKNLRSLILHLHKFMSKHPSFYLIWKKVKNSLEKYDQKNIPELHNRIHDLIKLILRQGQDAGTIRKDIDNDFMADLILGMSDGLKKNPLNVYIKEQSIDDLLSILFKGISEKGVDTTVFYEKYEHESKSIR